MIKIIWRWQLVAMDLIVLPFICVHAWHRMGHLEALIITAMSFVMTIDALREGVQLHVDREMAKYFASTERKGASL